MGNSPQFRIDLSTGGAQRPWLVLVNGLFADYNSWDKIVPILTPHFNLFRFNGRGQGTGAIWHEPITLMDQIHDLKNLLEQNHIARASFLGISNGGRVALKFAELHPGTIQSLVICDSYGEMDAHLELKIKSWLQAAQTGDPVFRFNITAPWIFGETVIRNYPGVIDFYRERASQSDGPTVIRLIESALEKVEIKLQSITSPALIAVGEEDLLTPRGLQQRLAQALPNSHMEILKGGHASILEFPESVETIIIPFLLENSMKV